MCLAIYKPKGKKVTREALQNGFESNSDGAGFAVAVGGRILIRKGFFTFDEFMAAWESFSDEAAVIHFRYATHGMIGEKNCHPFKVNGRAMVHNGILSIASTEDSSDTAEFCRLVLRPLLAKVRADSPALRFLIEETIGAGNKIAILEPDGSATIYNEGCGIWHGGVWFSNSGFKRSQLEVFNWKNRWSDTRETEGAEIAAYMADGMTKEDAEIAVWESQLYADS